MPNFAVSTICFGPEADAGEVLEFADTSRISRNRAQ